ncbi:CRISPR-associated protein, Csn1 family [Planococcus antarcticus DSM 14505]|uniref:CRISPR-associated endonuclease Cas9 n=1 Tax=Planococcus antarcticus DSM 14505 TaxID=1185653 RepID=A0A1C7DHH3_9BACL|nr:type II CRISPR RNA-guided endonuclease Cas9 [Planococcus antarcticus]ANU10858.1 type II CRISPR RNA-guided endonuclease Cas9 [Planococcus antarcticus DSM 14505]EIM08310.1 CRISPR-associated protein, Csn1 family [Planococcus antarcticus DSM 14505]
MKNYTIGLDIGVASVGWVCIDENYKILNYNNRHAFGVHEFESAESAAGRRLKRGMRRRYNRRKKRLQLLQSLFDSYITDSGFFSKTDSQHFWKNNNEFENRSLTEVLSSLRISSRKYPTIYHLRSDLIESNKKMDLRLVYLALHNLVKYRGHFLQEGNWSEAASAEGMDDQLLELVTRYAELENLSPLDLSESQWKAAETLLLNRNLTKTDQSKELTAMFGKEYEPFCKLVAGLGVSLHQLFPSSEQALAYKETKTKVQLSNENVEEVMELLLEEESALLEAVQPFYQQVVLYELLKGETYVAKAKVSAFKQYQKDMASLKNLLDKTFGEKVYRSYFISDKNSQREYQKSHKVEVLCKLDQFNKEAKFAETFYKDLKKLLEDKSKTSIGTTEKDEMLRIIKAIDSNQFLQKQKGIQNAAIPHQNSLYEAEKILRNQQAHYPFITTEWIEKVKQILAFRIPYYIGPLVKDTTQSPFSWVERKGDAPITPWNFDEQIDKAASAEAFISRMRKTCTYLKGQEVLPKSSLTYERFEVLNELNGIQLRTTGAESDFRHRLSYEMKCWIIDNVFKQYKTVSTKRLLQELKKSPYADELYDEHTGEIKEVFGTQKENAFATSLSGYISMKSILGAVVDDNPAMTEELIYWIAVFEDREILHLKIQEKYPSITDVQRQKLALVKLPGWGRFSRLLIDGLPLDEQGQSVLDHMEQYSSVFMEVLKNKGFGLEKKIQKMNQHQVDGTKKIRYEDIEELAGSPALKRGIWRSVKIVEELVSIFGEPANIVLEVAREDGEKKRTKSRKDQWEELTKTTLKNDPDLKSFIGEIKSQGDQRFNEQRFWLYVTQQGKCLYTGKALDIQNLSMYEVDHILPQNFVKDDSLDNLALVMPEANQRKNQVGQNKMPLEIIEANQQYAMRTLWERLHELKLISSGKLGRLKKPSFDEVDKDKFIARQLVETRQIIKHVRDLLDERFSKSDIHLVKAGIVSKFRRFSEIPKIRDYNNKHHAMDALFAAALIQSILGKYGKNFLAFDLSKKDRQKQWRSVKGSNKEFFLFKNFGNLRLQSPVTGEEVSGVEYMKHVYFELPWQTTKMTQTGDGMFYKESIFSPKVKQAKYVSPKTEKFVHDEVKNHSICLVEFTFMKKEKEVQETKFIDLKVIEHHQFLKEPESQLAKFLAEKETNSPIIHARIIRTIPKYQKIWIEHFPYYFISTRELHNARQFEISYELMEKVKQLSERSSVEELKIVFGLLIDQMNDNYPIYTKSSIQDRVQKFVDTQLYDFKSFEIGFEELKKAVAANAQRSDTFGSRISKKPKPEEVAIGYESITGLKYRKPRSVVGTKR